MIHINSSSVEIFNTPMAIYNLMFVCTVIAVLIFSCIFARKEDMDVSRIFRINALMFFAAFLFFINKDIVPSNLRWTLIASMFLGILLVYYVIGRLLKIDTGKIGMILL